MKEVGSRSIPGEQSLQWGRGTVKLDWIIDGLDGQTEVRLYPAGKRNLLRDFAHGDGRFRIELWDDLSATDDKIDQMILELRQPIRKQAASIFQRLLQKRLNPPQKKAKKGVHRSEGLKRIKWPR